MVVLVTMLNGRISFQSPVLLTPVFLVILIFDYCYYILLYYILSIVTIFITMIIIIIAIIDILFQEQRTIALVYLICYLSLNLNYVNWDLIIFLNVMTADFSDILSLRSKTYLKCLSKRPP